MLALKSTMFLERNGKVAARAPRRGGAPGGRTPGLPYGFGDRMFGARRAGVLGVVLGFLLTFEMSGGVPVSLQDLLTARGMTARKFAGHFSNFSYTYREKLQSPEVFLARRDGDCDDYAVLADVVLPKHGLTTRLIHVRMAGLVAHVVCYVVEDRIYLDYNNRGYLVATEKCAADLRSVATRVAKSFSSNWTSVSEFTCTNGMKSILRTVAKTDPPSAVGETLRPSPKNDF